jgi:hypothetical protein
MLLAQEELKFVVTEVLKPLDYPRDTSFAVRARDFNPNFRACLGMRKLEEGKVKLYSKYVCPRVVVLYSTRCEWRGGKRLVQPE